MRLSVEKFCRAPMPAPVRTMATMSPGCTCSSTNFLREERTRAMLSKDRPRSSTTRAKVRRTCVGLRRMGGGGGAVLSTTATRSTRVSAARVLM